MPKAILHGLALAQFRSSATALARRGSRISTFLWWFMLLSSLAIVVYATRIFLAAPSDEHFFGYLLSFLFACILPEAWGRFRRALGSFPKIASTGAEPAPLARSLPLIGSRARLRRRLRHGLVSEQGLATSLGFGILAVLWFLTALEAYRTVRRGNIEAHRRWMIRNFALTLAAVIPRNQLPCMRFALDWPFPRSYVNSLLAMLGAELADRGMDGSQTQAAVPVPELSIKGGSP